MKNTLFLLLFSIVFFPSVKAQEPVRGDCAPKGKQEIIFDNANSKIPYRIPAIAKNNEGDLIAVVDYRYSGVDIGVVDNGKIDLLYRIKDGKTGKWGEIHTLASARGDGGEDFTAFSDPCIVADRESDKILVTSCSGNISFQKGTPDNHLGWSVFLSEDGGKTWTEYDEISQQVFNQLSPTDSEVPHSFFIASGKIEQSKKIKNGDFYRLYCAATVKKESRNYENFVFYSDDFGKNWKLLGDSKKGAIANKADEAKIVELPDGNVLVSSRISGGRTFNIFKYSDPEIGSGEWGEEFVSEAENSGLIASKNACNGEILCLPVKSADGRETFLLLQSVPLDEDGKRAKVGINYKELASDDSYSSPQKIGTNWDGVFMVTPKSSAYSTMCLDKDDNIAFLYEEDLYNGGFDIIFTTLPLETVTDGKYFNR